MFRFKMLIPPPPMCPFCFQTERPSTPTPTETPLPVLMTTSLEGVVLRRRNEKKNNGNKLRRVVSQEFHKILEVGAKEMEDLSTDGSLEKKLMGKEWVMPQNNPHFRSAATYTANALWDKTRSF